MKRSYLIAALIAGAVAVSAVPAAAEELKDVNLFTCTFMDIPGSDAVERVTAKVNEIMNPLGVNVHLEYTNVATYDEEVARRLASGETIDLMNESDTRGTNRSFGQSYQKAGRELMTRDELAVMPNGKCIVQVRALRPFYSDKYDIKRHPCYRMLAEAGGGEWRQSPSGGAEIRPEEPYEFFEGEAGDL